jgi:hypothetical protein
LSHPAPRPSGRASASGVSMMTATVAATPAMVAVLRVSWNVLGVFPRSED